MSIIVTAKYTEHCFLALEDTYLAIRLVTSTVILDAFYNIAFYTNVLAMIYPLL